MSTTFTGTGDVTSAGGWSSGLPDITVDAIINGKGTIANNKTLVCKSLVVTTLGGIAFTESTANSTIHSAGSITLHTAGSTTGIATAVNSSIYAENGESSFLYRLFLVSDTGKILIDGSGIGLGGGFIVSTANLYVSGSGGAIAIDCIFGQTWTVPASGEYASIDVGQIWVSGNTTGIRAFNSVRSTGIFTDDGTYPGGGGLPGTMGTASQLVSYVNAIASGYASQNSFLQVNGPWYFNSSNSGVLGFDGFLTNKTECLLFMIVGHMTYGPDYLANPVYSIEPATGMIFVTLGQFGDAPVGRIGPFPNDADNTVDVQSGANFLHIYDPATSSFLADRSFPIYHGLANILTAASFFGIQGTASSGGGSGGGDGSYRNRGRA